MLLSPPRFMKNYFTDLAIAQRYATSRRSHHSLVVNTIRELCDLREPQMLGLAVDVGCGTGMSAVPLTELARKVIAVDSSRAMLACAVVQENITYVCAGAEALPLPDESADIVTAGSAFHWFDQPCFLAEAARALHPGGYLAIYGDWFMGSPSRPAVRKWYTESHTAGFPAPPRGRLYPDVAEAAALGFTEIGRSDFSHDQDYTLDAFVDYLITQSNVGAVVQAGERDLRELAEELRESTAGFFSGRMESFSFNGAVMCFLKSE